MIRPATIKDVPELVYMLECFNEDWDYVGKLPIDPDHAGRYFADFIGCENVVTGIAEHDGVVAGTIGLLIINHPFAASPVLHKAFWYAKPEFPGIGRELLRFAKAVGRENGVRQFYVGSMHPRVSKLLEREGFKPQETSYLMEF